MNSDDGVASKGAPQETVGDRAAPSAPRSAPDEVPRVHEFSESDVEDLELVRATRAGDKSAYDQLYTKHRNRVYAIVYRIIRNREDALEGTQEVFIKVYNALPRYKEQYRFTAWLNRISTNQAIDQYRKRRTRREQEYDQEYTLARPDQSVHQRFNDPGAEMDRSYVSQRIEAALATLSETHRQVFTLFSYEELSYAEIADIMDSPIGTVMSRLYYARRKLQEALPPGWDPGGRKNREKREGDDE